MKKLLSILILVLFVVLSPKALAAEGKVLTADATEDKTGVITVKGTTEDSVIAVSVSVYDENGEFIKVVHGQVNDDNTYLVTIEMEAKKYIVRTANYDGGEYVEKTVEPSNSNVKTGDSIYNYVIMGIVSVIGIVGASLFIYKKSKN